MTRGSHGKALVVRHLSRRAPRIGARPAAGSQRSPFATRDAGWLGAIVVLLAAMLVHTLAYSSTYRYGVSHSPAYQWNVIGQYFTARPVLLGLEITIELTVLAMAIGIFLGIAFAVMRLSTNPLVSSASWLYIWFFAEPPCSSR